ncbi:MAG TPA: hypothetical protein VNT57_02925 [Desulfobacteria bacterium]|nr:hypothetical protein [Desulfobacteria bacterium]
MIRKLFVIVLVFFGIILTANASMASPKGMGASNPGDKLSTYGATDCELCHANSAVRNAYGPHGGYTTTTNYCQTCHVVHNRPGGRQAVNSKLLVGATVTDTCQFCHDITGSDIAPYSTTKMSGPSEIQSAHRIQGITTGNSVITDWAGYDQIPGGDPSTGGSALLDASQGDLSGLKLTCDSCHTPHGLRTLLPYLGESVVKSSTSSNDVQPGFQVFYLTSRLLKVSLQVDGAVYSDYGSGWCAGCHQGRLSMTGNGSFNHPVDQDANAYDWGTIAQERGILENGGTADDVNLGTSLTATGKKPISVLVYDFSGEETSDVWVKMFGDNGIESFNVTPKVAADPRSNMWYTMDNLDPISGDTRLDGYRSIDNYPNGPACQQCHASGRDVENAFVAGSNPEVSSFPHISKNQYLLVENSDDLCTNCHGLDNLP